MAQHNVPNCLGQASPNHTESRRACYGLDQSRRRGGPASRRTVSGATQTRGPEDGPPSAQRVMLNARALRSCFGFCDIIV